MKDYFNSEIEGKEFFKKYILFLIPLVILSIIVNYTDESFPLLSFIASFAESYVVMLLWFSVFAYIIKFVNFRENGFQYKGSVGEIAPKLIGWSALSFITLGIYSPWMIKHIADYILENTVYEDKKGEFLSSPGRLLKYMLLTLYLPVLILTILFVVFMVKNIASDSTFYNPVFGIFTFIFIIAMILVLIPFMYYYFTWLVNLRYGKYRAEFNRSMGEFAAFIIPQLLLSLITLFIYYPAAIINIYRFLLEGSVYKDDNNVEKGGFGFDGTTGRGFGLIWGQGLLCLITLGIYGPWAIAKLGNWGFNNIWIESRE